MFSTDVTVCIPTIKPRRNLLRRAVDSVLAQTVPASAIAIREDRYREGAAVVRQAALDSVNTTWVAFLDDDDVLLPHHLETLLRAACFTSADYLYAWYQIVDSDGNRVRDTVLGHFGKPFDRNHPHQTTITTLVRAELAKSVGFLRDPGTHTIHGQRAGEDFAFTLGCIEAGAKFHHEPEITWEWHHHGKNTSGLNNRW